MAKRSSPTGDEQPVTTFHAHPGLAAVRSGAVDSEGQREFSSGLLIAPRLVLGSRHGVASALRASRPGLVVQLVTGVRGALKLTEVPGRVAWLGSNGLDAALIELPREYPVPEGFGDAHITWAEPVGTRSVLVSVTGMPSFAASSTGERAEVETLLGELKPDTYTASGRYAVDLPDGWPGTWSDWAGMSGAAVTCRTGGYLIGVVAWSDKPLQGRRLTAVPVSALLSDAKFRYVLRLHLGRIPEIEPAELSPFLSHPQVAGSPGALLRADAGLTAFAGRDTEIAALKLWRDEPVRGPDPDLKAILITGRGGEGKTRLALEFLALSRREGWVGGVLQPEVSPERAEVVAYASRPLLLVIDYAAAHGVGLSTLIQTAIRVRPRARIRLLLLARAAGQWWDDLAADLEGVLNGLGESTLQLGPLLPSGHLTTEATERLVPDRATVFKSTAQSLAPHLVSFTLRTIDELHSLAADLEVPDLSSAQFEHALSIQMAALAALLQKADPVPAAWEGQTVEDTLLAHERKYRDRVARQSRRNLEDLRSVRDRAVVSAALLGARGASYASAVRSACSLVEAALDPELKSKVSLQREVAAWVREIYPPGERIPDGPHEYWGRILPDRLCEFLVLRILACEEVTDSDEETNGETRSLIESVARRCDAQGAAQALLILSRAAVHDSQAGLWAARLVSASPSVAGPAALQVATYAENPAPLRAALIALEAENPDAFVTIMTSVEGAEPRFSLRRLDVSAGLTREVVAIYRHLVKLKPESYLSALGASLSNHALRLSESGRVEEAVPLSEEAIDLSRQLVAVDPGFRPGLATALNNYSAQLEKMGRQAEAVFVSEEALALRRALVAVDRDVFLPALAMSLSNHSTLLEKLGQRNGALPAGQEAVGLYRELAAENPGAYLPALAKGLTNHAVLLAKTGLRTEAMPISEEALTLCRDLAQLNPDAYLPDLAKSLANHATRLAERGRNAAAEAASAEAVKIYRELAAVNREAYLSDLAISLTNHAIWLEETGQFAEAVKASEEAVALCRELANINRTAYLRALAASLSNHALGFLIEGRRLRQ